ncbi:MAG: Uma2 family endonuclease [Caldilineaceae bacterium]|nr:Uma2 family endonuclease [Caldilineaceae bacterium]
MSAHPQYKRLYTVEEYFELEEKSDIKHEYYRGEIFAMAGGSVNHNRIARNVLTTLDGALRDGPCEPFGSDLRTLIEAHTLYTYPDVTVVCGGVDADPKRRDRSQTHASSSRSFHRPRRHTISATSSPSTVRFRRCRSTSSSIKTDRTLSTTANRTAAGCSPM